MYFDVKSFSFAKKNPHKMSKPLHLRKLVQEKYFGVNAWYLLLNSLVLSGTYILSIDSIQFLAMGKFLK